VTRDSQLSNPVRHALSEGLHSRGARAGALMQTSCRYHGESFTAPARPRAGPSLSPGACPCWTCPGSSRSGSAPFVRHHAGLPRKRLFLAFRAGASLFHAPCAHDALHAQDRCGGGVIRVERLRMHCQKVVREHPTLTTESKQCPSAQLAACPIS